MKSAYELAMSRLEKQAPTVVLTEAQKTQLAELESFYAAKIAERQLLLESEIAKAADHPEEQIALRKQLGAEMARLEEERESKKDRVRRES